MLRRPATATSCRFLNRASAWSHPATSSMPRQQHDREDLLSEATALVERVSLQMTGCEEQIVVGFRRDGSASMYWGGNRVYQFTSLGHLRRAFVGELLYKAEAGQLISLRRERTDDVVALTRHELSQAETQAFLVEMREKLERLHDSLAKRNFTVVGQISTEGDPLDRTACWLDEFAGRVAIARSPRVS
jgi:hypothetical protein